MSSAETLQRALARQRRRSFALPRPPALLALAALAAVLLFAAQTLLLSQRRPQATLLVSGRAAAPLLTGFYAAEQDGRGSYRWTAGDGRISFAQVGLGSAPLLELRLGPPPLDHPPPELRLALGTGGRMSFATNDRARSYRVLLPPEALRLGSLELALQSRIVTVPPDLRPVGLRVEQVALTFLGPQWVWPAPGLLLTQTGLLALGALLLQRLRLPKLVAPAAVLLGAAALFFMSMQQPLLRAPYLLRLLGALGVLAALTYGLLPVVERRLGWLGPPVLVRALWAVALMACTIRLMGALYPAFTAFDLPLNVRRLLKSAQGTLAITNRSFEFGGGTTVYPTGPYLVLLPGLLTGLVPPLLVQGSMAIIDGFGALAVGALARRLGTSGRAAIYAGLLYAGVPIGLTALFLGHSAQVFSQALLTPLALLLLAAFGGGQHRVQGSGFRVSQFRVRWSGGGASQRTLRSTLSAEPRPLNPDPQLWLATCVLLTMVLLSHIGSTIMALGWLGLAWLALAWRRELPARGLRSFALALAGACVAGAALVYADVALLHLRQVGSIGAKVAAGEHTPALPWITRGWLLGFQPLGCLLLPIGLLLLLRRHLPPSGHALLGAGIAAAALFMTVEIASGLQVRYIYFLVPLFCIGVGLLLDRLGTRGYTARTAAWATLLLLLLQGSALWYMATLAGVKMSAVPLLR